MNLAFVATSLEHMRRRSEFPKESRPLPLAVKSAAGDAEAKASITNAALSTDVRGGFAGTEDALRAPSAETYRRRNGLIEGVLIRLTTSLSVSTLPSSPIEFS